MMRLKNIYSVEHVTQPISFEEGSHVVDITLIIGLVSVWVLRSTIGFVSANE